MIYLQKTEVILKLQLPQKLHDIWVNTLSHFPPLLAIDGENLWCDHRHGALNADGPSVPSTPQQKRWYWSSQQTRGRKNQVHEWGEWADCQHEIKMSSLARARSPTPGSFSSNRRIWAINTFVVTSGASGFCCELRQWAGREREREREGRSWRLHLGVSTQRSPVNRRSHEAGSLMTEVGEARLHTWTPSRMTSPSSVRLAVKKRPSTNCTRVSRWFYCTPKPVEDNFSFTTSARHKASVNHLNRPPLAATPGEARCQHCQTSVCVCLLLKPKVTVSA